MYLESKHANIYNVFKIQAQVSALTDKFHFEVRIHIKLPLEGQGLDSLFCLTHQDIINLSRGLHHTNYTEIKKATLLQCITGFSSTHFSSICFSYAFPSCSSTLNLKAHQGCQMTWQPDCQKLKGQSGGLMGPKISVNL